tara:strand:- start:172 stop:654 length:483 start_codon:yes stop_codon:yes gene_type:complete
VIHDVIVWFNIESIVREISNIFHFFFDYKGHIAEWETNVFSQDQPIVTFAIKSYTLRVAKATSFLMNGRFSGGKIVDLESFDSAELLRDSEAVLVKDVDVALGIKDDRVIFFDVESFVFKVVNQVPREDCGILQLLNNDSNLVWIISCNNILYESILLRR